MVIANLIFRIMPFLFGIGFLAPLTAETLVALGITPPFGLAPIGLGLIVGGAWGAVATITGRWL